MVFITAGLGGGTGTGAGPVVAEVAKRLRGAHGGDRDAAVLLRGLTRKRQADGGTKEPQASWTRSSSSRTEAAPDRRKGHALRRGVPQGGRRAFRRSAGSPKLVTKPGYINLDFADVKTIMSGMGVALMGTGTASGQNRAVAAAEKAISSPLLEDVSIRGARGVLINITAGTSLSLSEVNDAASLVREEASDEANIIFGTVIDETMGDELKVTVVATGFEPGVAEGAWRNPRKGIKLVSRADDLQTPAFLRAAAPKTFGERLEDLPDRQGGGDRVARRVRDPHVPPSAGGVAGGTGVVGRPRREDDAPGPQTRSSPRARIGEPELASPSSTPTGTRRECRTSGSS